MHKHFCEVTGHVWVCHQNCGCICGLPVDVFEHSQCAVEFRPCPEHKVEAEQLVAEAMFLGSDALSDDLHNSDMQVPHCNCGCSDLDPEIAIGFCLWCSHVYVDCDPELEDQHFAQHCPEAPLELKEAARKRLTASKT